MVKYGCTLKNEIHKQSPGLDATGVLFIYAVEANAPALFDILAQPG